ncbi:MAG: AmmeMemoRadiSam system protein A [Acidobacteriota bacterium]
MALSEVDDRRRLLSLARAALSARVHGTPPPELPADLNLRAAGVFVTIHCAGDLRGCLGSLEARESLTHAVVHLAAAVADEDPRFAPVRPEELDAVVIDLSILTSPERVDDLTTIVLGRDGLIVEEGRRHGLLLPQVAVEHGWTREMFLSQACLKAGLSADAWRRGATVQRFRAEVVRESDFSA